MAIAKAVKAKKDIDPDVFSEKAAKKSSPPMPKGPGGPAVVKATKGDIDPDAFSNGTPVKCNPPAPKM